MNTKIKAMEPKNNTILPAREAIEKITKHLEEKKGITVLEGFGIPEFPLISLNTSDFRGVDIAGKPFTQKCKKVGSVGRLMPGMAVRISQLNNFNEDSEGELLIKGYNSVDSSELADGWFNSKVLGKLDKDGFLTLKH